MASQLGRRARLAAAIDAAVNGEWCERPFEWGTRDCLLSLADIIHRANGYDPAAEYRGRYHSMRGALRVTRALGGFAGALESAAIEHCWRRIEPDRALVGDIGIVANVHGLRIGVIKHYRLWVTRREGYGFATFGTGEVERAWRVTA